MSEFVSRKEEAMPPMTIIGRTEIAMFVAKTAIAFHALRRYKLHAEECLPRQKVLSEFGYALTAASLIA